MITSKRTTSKDLDTTIGWMGHVGFLIPWVYHFLSRRHVGFLILWVYHFLSRLRSLHYRSKNRRFINSQRHVHVHERFGVNERNSGKSKTWYWYELTHILSAWPNVLFRSVPSRARGIQQPRACMPFSCPISSAISSDQ
jgi:hypothetical protein